MRSTLASITFAAVLSLTITSPLFSAKPADRDQVRNVRPVPRPQNQPEKLDVKRGTGQRATPSPATEAALPDSTRDNGRRMITLPESDVAIPNSVTTQGDAKAPADLQIDWLSINHGGAIEVASENLKLGVSVAQTVAGEVSSPTHRMGLGFWYVTAGPAVCDCPWQCDYDEDGILTILDLGALIDVLFAGRPEIHDPNCPTSRGDFDNNHSPDILDIGLLIDRLFASGPEPCNPCDPIQSSCAK